MTVDFAFPTKELLIPVKYMHFHTLSVGQCGNVGF